MISLNNYISESIYGNLGIDDSIDRVKVEEWIDIYNSQPERKAAAVVINDKGNVRLTKPKLYIMDNRLLDRGRIPEYIHFVTDTTFLQLDIYIDASNIISLAGLPIDKHNAWECVINIENAPKLTDWSILNNANCKISITADMSHNSISFKNLLANIKTFKADVTPSTVSSLNTLHGCMIDSVILIGDATKKENELGKFLKNNIIKKTNGHGVYDSVLNMISLNLNNFDFAKDINKRSDTSLIIWPAKGDWWDDENKVKTRFEPLRDAAGVKEIRMVYSHWPWALDYPDFKRNYQKYKDAGIIPKNCVNLNA